MRPYKHLAAFPGEDKAALKAATHATGLSVNQIIVQSVRERLPAIVARHRTKAGRLTNVDPLPDKVLKEIYSRPERDEAGIDCLIAAQAKGARD